MNILKMIWSKRCDCILIVAFIFSAIISICGIWKILEVIGVL